MPVTWGPAAWVDAYRRAYAAAAEQVAAADRRRRAFGHSLPSMN